MKIFIYSENNEKNRFIDLSEEQMKLLEWLEKEEFLDEYTAFMSLEKRDSFEKIC